MTSDDVRVLAWVALVAVAPVVVVLLAAILRGYTVTLHMTREAKRRERPDD